MYRGEIKINFVLQSALPQKACSMCRETISPAKALFPNHTNPLPRWQFPLKRLAYGRTHYSCFLPQSNLLVFALRRGKEVTGARSC